MAERKQQLLSGKGLELDVKPGGGYGMRRSAESPPSKMEQRREQRRADYESTMEQGVEERDARRAARKESFQPKTTSLKFNKGGMIKGSQCREYGKK